MHQLIIKSVNKKLYKFPPIHNDVKWNTRERADLMTITVVVDGKTNLNPNTLWSVYISSHSYLFAHAWNAQKRESCISHYAPINKWRDLKVKSMWKERRERERVQKAKGCEFKIHRVQHALCNKYVEKLQSFYATWSSL